jgi:hypothetical protein
METINPIRRKAQKDYDAALAIKNVAEHVGEKEYAAAAAILDIARRLLVAAELQYPTRRESMKKDSELRSRNRGWDF